MKRPGAVWLELRRWWVTPLAICLVNLAVLFGYGLVLAGQAAFREARMARQSAVLGLGIQPPRPSLGSMLLEAASLSALRAVPWMLLAPGLAAFTMVLAWNLLGDALNDVLNPRTR